MLDLLWTGDTGLLLGALGFVSGIASLIYSRSQARGTHAQLKSAKQQAEQALRAAELVADGARQQAAEALKAASLVAQSAREQAVEALRAAGIVAENARIQAIEALSAARLVAEGAREQAAQALLAAELLASSAVSARVREVRARNFRSTPDLPASVQATIAQAGGADAYSVMLDSMDVAQEIYVLRQRGLVSDENWRRWMDDQMLLVSRTPSFEEAFRRDAEAGILAPAFVAAFEPVFGGGRVADPEPAKAHRNHQAQVARRE
jgi:hypothetical protein